MQASNPSQTDLLRTVLIVAGAVALIILAVRFTFFGSSASGWGAVLWGFEGIAIAVMFGCALARRRR
jgi:hypothetical protein